MMEFNSNKPIFLQIYDSVCEKVIREEVKAGDRIMSVREFGADIGVNPNTIMRSYERLTNDGIIFNKRGIGYFICDGAKETALQNMRREFMDKELPEILKKMKLLGISADVLSKHAEEEIL